MNDVDTFKTYSMVDVLERSKQPEPDQVERYTAQDLLDPCKQANEFFEQRNKEVHDAMMRFIRLVTMESLISLAACVAALACMVFIGALIFFLLYWVVDITGGDVSEPFDFLGVLVLIVILGGFVIAAGNHVITMCWGE